MVLRMKVPFSLSKLMTTSIRDSTWFAIASLYVAPLVFLSDLLPIPVLTVATPAQPELRRAQANWAAVKLTVIWKAIS